VWEVSEKVWEALVQSQFRFTRVPQNIPAVAQSQVRFNGFRGRLQKPSQVRFI
jgi:hypothetical protein